MICLSIGNYGSGIPADVPTISYRSIPVDDEANAARSEPRLKRNGRRVPTTVRFSELQDSDLEMRAVPLPEAETLVADRLARGRIGRIEWAHGARLFNPEILLIKFRTARHVAALRVEELRELDALRELRKRKDVEFAELDLLQERQFAPNDPFITNQWHHSVIGSFSAWRYSLGSELVRVAIVDTPFQMNHPDLAAHTDAGWDVVKGVPINSADGIDHSTLTAGMAAAVIGNGVGTAGASNCRILPININGAISEMYEAVIWAADHGVRVVNISWTGGDSESLNAAGSYLKEKARGILAMSGVNGAGFLNYTNQPNIYCISMTDAADNPRSRFGNHIDFSAPGFEIFSTTTNSSYGFASGTSYSTPLFCGVVATLFSINPALSPEGAIDLLKSTAKDLGSVGWDQFHGFGRIDFARAAERAQASRLAVTGLQVMSGEAFLTITNATGLDLVLWKRATLDAPWEEVKDAILTTNAGIYTVADRRSESESKRFYRVEGRIPEADVPVSLPDKIFP
jgi:subtilisin family serine protease